MALRASPFITLMAAAALVAGCADNPEDLATGATEGAGASQAGGVDDPRSVEYFNLVVGDRVFFGTDRFDLDIDAQTVLARQAQWLLQNPGISATIEGHADERGTREYNLGLGARRASSARDYLVSQGVEPNRLRTVTFGKERPVSLCSDESCWSQNRRSVTVVAGAPTS